jgi:hypothetical protein
MQSLPPPGEGPPRVNGLFGTVCDLGGYEGAVGGCQKGRMAAVKAGERFLVPVPCADRGVAFHPPPLRVIFSPPGVRQGGVRNSRKGVGFLVHGKGVGQGGVERGAAIRGRNNSADRVRNVSDPRALQCDCWA